MNPRIGWGQPPAGWGQPLPGWAPLVDHGPHPLQTARSVGRWWWPTVAVSGFLAIVVQVLGHDDPTPDLTGLLTVALAATVVALLTIHRRRGPGPLARAMAEYAVVALLATLLAAPGGGGVDQPPANRATGAAAEAQAQATAGDDQPGVLQAGAKVVRAVTAAARAVTGTVRWLVDLWRQADHKAEPANSQAMAPLPLPPLPSVSSTWRSP